MIILLVRLHSYSFFFFNDTATTEIYTLSLHDALPISRAPRSPSSVISSSKWLAPNSTGGSGRSPLDRKSTRLNSSHLVISYAVFCLKKKKTDYLKHHIPMSPQLISHSHDSRRIHRASP